MVLWDVLKDVDEVKSVDFSVRAELIMDNSPKNKSKLPVDWKNKRYYIIPSWGQQGNSLFGIRLAYMGSFGITGKYIFRGDRYNASIDLTKRVINKGGFQLYFMLGLANASIAYAKDPVHQDNYLFKNVSTYEIGIVIAIKRVVIYYAATPYKPPYLNEYCDNGGIGIRF
jgi:hypothetical protein